MNVDRMNLGSLENSRSDGLRQPCQYRTRLSALAWSADLEWVNRTQSEEAG